MNTFENGKTYIITNVHGAQTTLHVKNNSLYADNGANCGTVKDFENHPQYNTLTITQVHEKLTASQAIKEINAHLEKTDRELNANSRARCTKDLNMLANTARYFPANFEAVLKYAGFVTIKKKGGD